MAVGSKTREYFLQELNKSFNLFHCHFFTHAFLDWILLLASSVVQYKMEGAKHREIKLFRKVKYLLYMYLV